jgi:hypothetical protein
VSSVADHMAKAQHNEDFSVWVNKLSADAGDFDDWEVVALFYASVHLVDALLARHNEHPTCHAERNPNRPAGRNNLVQQRFPLLWPHYRTLLDLSHRARYEATQRITPTQARAARTQDYSSIKTIALSSGMT